MVQNFEGMLADKLAWWYADQTSEPLYRELIWLCCNMYQRIKSFSGNLPNQQRARFVARMHEMTDKDDWDTILDVRGALNIRSA